MFKILLIIGSALGLAALAGKYFGASGGLTDENVFARWKDLENTRWKVHLQNPPMTVEASVQEVTPQGIILDIGSGKKWAVLLEDVKDLEELEPPT